MPKYTHEFSEVSLSDLPVEIKKRQSENWHFIQMCCIKTDDGHDLLYSFIKDGKHDDFSVSVNQGSSVPSITNEFIAAFVFENEAHDLFGVEFTNLAIDFKGTFYKLAEQKPMEVVSPEVIARKEKQKKIEAAMAAKKAKDAKKVAEAPKAEVKQADSIKPETKPAKAEKSESKPTTAEKPEPKKGEGE